VVLVPRLAPACHSFCGLPIVQVGSSSKVDLRRFPGKSVQAAPNAVPCARPSIVYSVGKYHISYAKVGIEDRQDSIDIMK